MTISVVEISPGDNAVAALWLRDKLHPDWSDEVTIKWCQYYFPSIQAREFMFYQDETPIGYLSTAEGINFHYGKVIDTFSVTSPDARGNRALLKAMLEQSKQVCHEAGIEWLVRSVHISENISRTITTKI